MNYLHFHRLNSPGLRNSNFADKMEGERKIETKTFWNRLGGSADGVAEHQRLRRPNPDPRGAGGGHFSGKRHGNGGGL